MDFALPHSWPLVVAGGFVVGLLVGLTGVGAGSLTTPFLISAVGINPLIAVGTDLLFACITKTSAAYRHFRLNNVDLRIVGWLSAGSLPAAAAVFLWFAWSGQDTAVLGKYIRQMLAAALLFSAGAIAIYPIAANVRRAAALEGDALQTTYRPFMTMLLGLVLGTAVAVTSVGAGAIGVVALTMLFPRLQIRRLVGTDIVHAIPLTLIAGLAHLRLGNVDPGLLATLLAGSIPGIAIGSRLTGQLPDWVLRAALSAMLCIAAFAVTWK